ncbi:aminomethyltransferase family protein [Aliamphritea spongicola]|nr:aminomethyltransferase family protein [Aliamphritea spongicola]
MGAITLSHPLSRNGGIAWEYSITKLADQHYYIMAPAAAELLVEDWLRQRLPADNSVQLNNITRDYGTLVLAGPEARRILSKLTDTPLDNDSFPWFTGQQIEVAGVPVRALRMNFVGELGWELHHPIEHQLALYDALMEAGAAHGIGDFGLRAMDSLRLEKGYPMWGHDLNLEFNSREANLSYFVKTEGREFEGKAALQESRGDDEHRLVLLSVDSTDVDASTGMEPVYCNGEIVGQVSSGGYGHRIQQSLALAYVRRSVLDAELSVKVLGNTYPARRIKGCAYDPSNARLKA